MPPLDWRHDQELGPGFRQLTLSFTPTYESEVTASVVRLLPPTTAAILYLHGFVDYFFQRHVAGRFNAAGHKVYGLDRRKYGRSLKGAAHPNVCLALPLVPCARDAWRTRSKYA